jgi:hypothetical protein
LLLPPDFSGTEHTGFISVRFPTYNGYSLTRAIPAGSTQADVAASLALVKKLRVYPLAQAANPSEQRFIDIHGKTFDGVASFDESFFESLARMVQEEPVQPRDLVAMGMLKSIGIEKGKQFKPDVATQRILKEAAQETLGAFVDGMRSLASAGGRMNIGVFLTQGASRRTSATKLPTPWKWMHAVCPTLRRSVFPRGWDKAAASRISSRSTITEASR